MHAGLVSDRRGAIMVMGVFMAAIAAGFLYYMVGLGDAILAKEGMQDAADASAYSAAVVSARGMNVLALINTIMAAVLAALVLLKILSSLLRMAGAVMLGMVWLFPPLFVAAGTTEKAGHLVESAANTLVQPAVRTTLIAGHALAKGVRRIVPAVASGKAFEMVSEHYNPPAAEAWTASMLRSLPAVDDRFATLCEKASGYAGELMAVPIEALTAKVGGGTAGEIVGDIVKDGVVALTTTYSAYYCGQSDRKPRPYEVKYDIVHPLLETESSRTCREEHEESACERARDETHAARDLADPGRGTCGSSGRDRELCEERLTRARRECAKLRSPQGDVFKTWKWYEKTNIYRYRLEESERGSRVLGPEIIVDQTSARLRESSANRPTPPCHENAHPLTKMYWTEWSEHGKGPICSKRHERPVPKSRGWSKHTDGSRILDIQVNEVTIIDSCTAEHREEVEVAAQQISRELRRNVPQRMCNCAELGEEIFQIRSIAVGDPLSTIDESRLRVATLGRDPAGSASAFRSVLERFSRIAVAQAEFYFAPTDADMNKRSEWLWHMNWKARMRRFRLEPTGWQCPAVRAGQKNECPAGPTGRAGQILNAVAPLVDGAVMH